MRKLALSIALAFLIPSLAFGGASRSLDGAGDRLTQGDIFNVTTGDISFCMFHKLTEDASIDQVIGRRTTTGGGWALIQSTSDVVTCTFDGASGQRDSVSPTDTDGAWTVTCCTWVGSTDISTLYTNGVQEDQDDHADAGSLNTGAFTRMGADGAATADYDLTGNIAYGAVWNAVVLTAVQVAEYRWRPELSGAIPDMLIPAWGDSSEVDLSANDDPAGVTGTTVSDDGPPVMIGDSSV